MTMTVTQEPQGERRPRILVVEDDFEIRDVICRYLGDHGMEIETEGSGANVFDKLDGVDLIVLDLQLPEADGIEILRELRRQGHLPVLIVSARGEGVDRVAGLELGADDYLTKPFLPRELVARVKALLRRARLPSSSTQQVGPLSIDTESRVVRVNGDELHLTPREYSMLNTLFQARGKTFSREELLDRIWGEEYLGETRRVDLLISKVRAKLAERGQKSLVRSVWGVGYRYDA